jgi:hypothetical protein
MFEGRARAMSGELLPKKVFEMRGLEEKYRIGILKKL